MLATYKPRLKPPRRQVLGFLAKVAIYGIKTPQRLILIQTGSPQQKTGLGTERDEVELN